MEKPMPKLLFLKRYNVDRLSPKKKQAKRKCGSANSQSLPRVICPIFQQYKSFFLEVVTAAGLSDVLTQLVIQKKAWDCMKTGRFLLVVLLIMAPLQYYWMNLLNSIKGSIWGAGFKRMLVDQIVGAPVFITLFFVVMGIFEGYTFSRAILKARTIFYPVLMNSYRIWPFVQLVNMSIVPVQFRFIFGQVISFFWSMYISYMMSKAG
uniref:Mitochondrial inner membrane protein Mpv17 n=1 Tax=Acrobeloides nanus TaxID=290746 RepID=A0A914CY56_9BILA